MSVKGEAVRCIILSYTLPHLNFSTQNLLRRRRSFRHRRRTPAIYPDAGDSPPTSVTHPRPPHHRLPAVWRLFPFLSLPSFSSPFSLFSSLLRPPTPGPPTAGLSPSHPPPSPGPSFCRPYPRPPPPSPGNPPSHPDERGRERGEEKGEERERERERGWWGAAGAGWGLAGAGWGAGAGGSREKREKGEEREREEKREKEEERERGEVERERGEERGGGGGVGGGPPGRVGGPRGGRGLGPVVGGLPEVGREKRREERERGREIGRKREEERERGVVGDRSAGVGAGGGRPEVSRRRPLPAAERSPATENTWGEKNYMR
ncbi:hypothetical protein TIFTF001_052452 [Ficus carica]|uniref:Uncharacterized protein n=1 Tax=Ficus carica TaxID=3494 RepID=A0AA88EJE1_FICCA|nr:hypothetical protein TIFTF001_052452 [Ficus carica]